MVNVDYFLNSLKRWNTQQSTDNVLTADNAQREESPGLLTVYIRLQADAQWAGVKQYFQIQEIFNNN